VTLSLAEMTRAHAEGVASWRYEAPYDVYDPSEGAVEEYLAGGYLAVLDDGEVVGFVCLGDAARVPGGPPPDDAVTDVGIGVAPGRLSGRVGTTAGELALETLRMSGLLRLRASVAEWNDRSVRLCLRLGFVPVGTFVHPRDAGTFVVLECELLD